MWVVFIEDLLFKVWLKTELTLSFTNYTGLKSFDTIHTNVKAMNSEEDPLYMPN